MAEDQTTAPAEPEALDDEFVEWHDENGNRCRGSRFGSSYKDFVLKWLAAEADHKAINGLPAEPAAEVETPAKVEPPSVPAVDATPSEVEATLAVPPSVDADADADAKNADADPRRRGRR
ncbi:hypothetical protein [Gordonia sputi]